MSVNNPNYLDVKVKIATSGGKLVDTKLIWVSQLLDGCV